MATKESLTTEDPLTPWGELPGHRRLYIRLGLLNGLLVGLALVLGVWGPEVYRLATLPVVLPYGNLWLGGSLILVIGAFVGWVTSLWRKIWFAVLAWLVTAVVLSVVIANIPTGLQTVAVWLSDSRAWGLPVYPRPVDVSFIAHLFGGIFMILAFLVLAIFQDMRLQGIGREFQEDQRPGPAAWLRFVLPLLVIIGVGALTTQVIKNPYGSALSLVHQAIQTGRSYDGDLFALGLEEGVNYVAVNSVRDRLDGSYALSISAVDVPDETVWVTAYFDNGAWIKCRVVYEQLSFCDDASSPYIVGLDSLLTGTPVPEDCRGCVPIVAPQAESWLAAHADLFATSPRLSRAAAWGPYVLMRAEGANGRPAVECWFSGLPRVQLDRCEVQ